jgi:ABC-type multidrug transport system fused ATPase/permease subunit
VNKGFEYWISDRVLSFLRKYWVIYCVFYLTAVLLAMQIKNSFVFLIIGFVPCILLFAYKTIHDPFYHLVESVNKIDPTLLQGLQEKSEKIQIHLSDPNKKQTARFVYAAIMLLDTEDIDKRIVSFKKNNKRTFWASSIGLSIWFFTFMVLLFVFYVKR